MVESVNSRLGVADLGEEHLVGNLLLYPRRIILELFRKLLQQDDLFTPKTASGSSVQRNPFLLELAADGVTPTKTSRIVLADYGSEKLIQEEVRPRLIIERGSGSFATSRLSSHNSQTSFGMGTVQEFSALFESSINMRCVSRVKIESELMANMVLMILAIFADQIRKLSELEHISMPQVGTTSLEKAAGDADQWSTQVQVGVGQAINWDLSKISTTVLNDICVTVAVQE